MQQQGNLRRAREALEVELAVYATEHAKEKPGQRVDILEGFAGKAEISKQAGKFGLVAYPPAELETGWDLNSSEGMALWLKVQREHQPLVTILGFPCTAWCAYNWNVNHRGRERELEERQGALRWMLQGIVASLHNAADAGRYFMFENPPSSGIWRESAVRGLAQRRDACTAIGHQCLDGSHGPRIG